MSNIKFITDSACDIPEDIAQELDIEVLCVPLTVNGKGYFERRDFTNSEFYDILLTSNEIPTTARVNTAEYLTSYLAAASAGVRELVVVTISSTGSGTNESAHLALESFRKKHPEAAESMNIYIIDSLSYSYGYGYSVTQGAKMAKSGAPIEEILEFVRDWTSSAEIFLACYNLDFAKKSGRIGSTAAFVGELLGLRPIVHMVDGGNDIIEKVRGDKNIIPRIVELSTAALIPGAEYVVVGGCLEEPVRELVELLTKTIGYPPAEVHTVGASIAINAGPKMIATVVRGKKRGV